MSKAITLSIIQIGIKKVERASQLTPTQLTKTLTMKNLTFPFTKVGTIF